MDYIEQNQASGRVILPDLVRAFALIGIALVNVGVIAYPMMKGYQAGGLTTPLDKSAFFTVNSLFLLKSYTLFSFMFGVGFAFQITSAQKKGAKFGARYTRRILGLLILGLLHIMFLFQGDILVIYAILGSLLFLFRNMKPRTLRSVAIGVYAFQFAVTAFLALMMWAGTTYAPEDMAGEFESMAKEVEASLAVYGNGTFAESIYLRFKEWGSVITFGLLMQGFGAFAFFLFGLSAVKSGIINDASAPIWKRFRRVFLPIGIAGSAWGAWMFLSATSVMSVEMMAGMAIITFFAPFSTAGYLGLIAKWAGGPMTPFKTFMARGGTATLTAYLMQGLLLSLIFNNYGLGLYAELGAAACTAIALLVALFTIAFTSLWRKRFERGPMETLLRHWTYLSKE